MNQRLNLLNQLRKQGLNIKFLTELFVGLVIARFQYALPVFTAQLTVSDINGIDTIFAKGVKWRLTTKLFKVEYTNEHLNKQ